MQRNIVKINISNELDVVLAYKRAMQLSERMGLTMGNQTKFSTAVSEICRNVVEHAGSGMIQFSVIEDTGKKYLEAVVSDRGRGIGNIDHLLKREVQHTPNGGFGTINNTSTRGFGIINSRKLVDHFRIESDYEKGTKVILRQRLHHNAPPLTKDITENWMRELDQESVSPYAEIKKQNMQLLDVLDNLRERNDVAQQQLEEISHLNEQLQLSNKNIQELLNERDRQNTLLVKINNDLDAFAHTVSHDLRAPLQNINGLANALQDCLATNKTSEAEELFPMLYEQTQRMDNFITSVLSYSMAGQNNIPKTETDVAVLIQDVLRLLGINDAVAIKMPPFLPVLLTEKIFLHQVFSNILNNAVKYHDMHVQPVIEIQYEAKGNWLQFAVLDNGPGISPENISRIFELYETLGMNNFRTDSVGLGLSIVEKIILKKGGRIWVESEGRGARFIFTWPANEIITK